MRLQFDWRLAAGSLAAIAMLALSSPGVRVVRADEEPGGAPLRPIAEGPSCQLDAERGRVEVMLELEPADEADSASVALNNGGYGYRPSAVAEEPIER